MADYSVPWTISVAELIMPPKEEPQRKIAATSSLASAVLYGSSVIWLPTDLPLLVAAALEPLAPDWLRDGAAQVMLHHVRPVVDDLKAIQAADSDFSIEVPTSLMQKPEDELRAAVTAFRQDADAMLNSLPPAPDGQDGAFKLLEKLIQEKAFTVLVRNAMSVAYGDSKEIMSLLQGTHACIVGANNPYKLQLPGHWDAHKAAHQLMVALSNVLLPEVSALPLAAVAELRGKLKDDLDPVRAALLRLTEDLRDIVDDRASEDDVAREAANIVKTRVEPVVRDASRRTREILSNRWRKFFQGAFKFIGLAGLGFYNPMFAKDAIKQGLDITAEAAVLGHNVRPATATARFVLEVRRNLPGHRN